VGWGVKPRRATFPVDSPSARKKRAAESNIVPALSAISPPPHHHHFSAKGEDRFSADTLGVRDRVSRIANQLLRYSAFGVAPLSIIRSHPRLGKRRAIRGNAMRNDLVSEPRLVGPRASRSFLELSFYRLPFLSFGSVGAFPSCSLVKFSSLRCPCARSVLFSIFR